MSNRDVRVIFDLDDLGEADGTVHPFCSDICRDAYIPTEPIPAYVESGSCWVGNFANPDDLRCETCGTAIGDDDESP